MSRWRLQPTPRRPYLFARTARMAGPTHRGHPMNFELLIPITLFACIAYSIKAVVDARVRKQLVSSNGAPDLVRSILEATR
jgi:hypothetical protein